MNNSVENALLTLYREKLNYLAECHKVYHGILGVLGGGIIFSFGYLVKKDTNHEFADYFILGVPFLVNAWFAAYLFCYWYNHLICWNVDYVEKLICKDLLNSKTLPTWYADFFGIFSLKWFAYVLFFTIALTVAFVYISSVCLSWKKEIIGEVFGKYSICTITIMKWLYIAYAGLVPSMMGLIHFHYIRKSDGKLKKYYADAGLPYRRSR